MADSKVSALAAATTLADTDIVYAVVGGASRKMTVADLRAMMTKAPIKEVSTATYTITQADHGYVLWFTVGCAVTVPEDATEAIFAGFQCVCIQGHADAVTFAKKGTDTLASKGALVSSGGQYAPVSVLKKESGLWWIGGDLA